MVALAFMISCFNTFAMRTSLATTARASDVPIWVVACLGRIRRAMAPIGGADEVGRSGGGIVFRISGQGDCFDMVRRLVAALLGLGQ